MSSAIAGSTQRALRVLSLAYFVQATGSLSVIGALAPISSEWGLSHSESAYLVSVFGVTFAIAAPLTQVFFGHQRRKLQVLIGLGVFSVSALLSFAAPNYGVLLASRVFMALGAGFIGPVLAALGSGLVQREQQGSAIAIVLLGLSVAGLAGIPISAWIAHALGARELFLTVAVVGFISAGLIV